MQIDLGDITLNIKKLHFLHFVQCAIQMEVTDKNGERCVLHSNIYWKDIEEERDFLSLNVEYREPSYSLKKFSSFKRDKYCEREILISRFIDRFVRLELAGEENKDFFISVQTVVFNSAFNMLQLASLCVIVNLRYLFPIQTACFASKGKVVVLSHKEILALSAEGVMTTDEIEEMLSQAKEYCQPFFKSISLIESKYELPVVKDQSFERKERKLDQIRDIEITNVSENSMIFSRGATSVMCFIDLIYGFDQFSWGERIYEKENILSQYFFPHFATQEGKRKSTSRREIGHSDLIRAAFKYVLDSHLIVRIVSETLSADGSSSMAAVCAASSTLFKMNLLSQPIAGLSLGSFDGKNIAVDLSAEEDKYSIMDCKIVGDETKLYVIQMDCKNKIPFSLFIKALKTSHKQLEKICKTISKVKKENSYLFTTIDKERIGYVLGKGGATKKNICYHIPSRIAVHESGKVLVCSDDVDLVAKFLQFYGRKPELKDKVAFFALEDFDGQIIKTTIGSVKVTKKIAGKKNDIIVGLIKDISDLTITVKEVLSSIR